MGLPSSQSQVLVIPLLQRMGVILEIGDVKPGYFPVGKGFVDIKVPKIEEIRPIRMVELGKPSTVVITYYVKDNKVPGSSK